MIEQVVLPNAMIILETNEVCIGGDEPWDNKLEIIGNKYFITMNIAECYSLCFNIFNWFSNAKDSAFH